MSFDSELEAKQLLKSWQELVQDRAMLLMTAMQRDFYRRINQASSLMPKNDNAHWVEYVNIFVDALLGNVALIIANYTPPNQNVEDAVVAGLKAKFHALRMKALGDKSGEEVVVAKETSEGAPLEN